MSRVSLAAASAALGAAAGALWLVAERVVTEMTAPTPPAAESGRGFTPFETGVRYEEVRIPAEDGTQLPGWVFLNEPDAPAILACGGYRGRRADLLGISSALWRAGCNVLLFDYRGHGERSSADAPSPVTLGYRELADARAALAYLRTRLPDAKLGVIGFSMGAAVALMVAAREPGVRAVIADSPFTSQRDIVRYRLRRASGRIAPLLTRPLGDAIVWLADRRLQIRHGFGFHEVQPLRDVSRLTQPLFLIHGGADREVPIEHSYRIARAAREAGVSLETWFLPTAHHCEAYFLDRPAYCRRAADFFTRHLAAGTNLSAPPSPVRAGVWTRPGGDRTSGS